jgi:hypothetical protein
MRRRIFGVNGGFGISGDTGQDALSASEILSAPCPF